MAVLKNFDNDELLITCKCGCDEGVHLKIHNYRDGDYAFMSFVSGKFYTGQNPLLKKLKKIWAIIRNKDFYYSDIIMTKDDLEQFKVWINSKCSCDSNSEEDIMKIKGAIWDQKLTDSECIEEIQKILKLRD